MEQANEQDIGFALGRTARRLYRLFDGSLRSLGLGFAQINLLGYLAEKYIRGESCSQKQICRECCSTRPSSVTSLLQTLEREGYIVREAGKDARVKQVRLTERGAGIAEQCQNFRLRVEEALSLGLSEEERKTVISCLSRMADNLDALSRTIAPGDREGV